MVSLFYTIILCFIKWYQSYSFGAINKSKEEIFVILSVDSMRSWTDQWIVVNV